MHDSTGGSILDKLYTAQETADVLKTGLRTVRRYLKTGLLVGGKIGKQWIVKESDIEAFVDSHRRN